jgi:hypothetical protein
LGDPSIEPVELPLSSEVTFTIDGDTTVSAEFAVAPVNYDLIIASSPNGTVTVTPEMEPYQAGSEVTLTATPNEGYVFAGWTAETQSGEPQTATVFDNLDHPRDEFISPLGRDRKPAQQFIMEGQTLSRVAVEQFRIGTVRGNIAFELWNDNGNNKPGEKIADIGTIEDVTTMPEVDTVYTFDTAISDLEPGGKYWVVRDVHGITSSLTGSNTIGWPWSFSRDGSNDAANSHGWRDQDGAWTNFNVPFGDLSPILMLQIRVQALGNPSTEPVELPQGNPVTFTIEGPIQQWQPTLLQYP